MKYRLPEMSDFVGVGCRDILTRMNYFVEVNN